MRRRTFDGWGRAKRHLMEATCSRLLSSFSNTDISKPPFGPPRTIIIPQKAMSASANTSTPPATFAVNERVLCYHGPLVYEAKILKTEHWDEQSTKTGVVGPHFYVHYKGWKQT